MYYKVDRLHRSRTLIALEKLRQRLAIGMPLVRVDVMQRSEENHEYETWMEIYRSGSGITAEVQVYIESIARSLPGLQQCTRMAEIFIPLRLP